MPEPVLRLRERTALLALMTANQEISNTDLRALAGFTLTGDQRRVLNEAKYVSSRKVGQTYHHELTDQGLAWCRDELGQAPPPRAGSAGGTLYAVLAGLGRYLDRTGLELAEVFAVTGDEPPTGGAGEGDLEARIIAAYHDLARAPGAWVGLTRLRAALGDEVRADLDAALVALYQTRAIDLAPESNRKALSDADRDAALRVGGEENHVLAIEAS